MVRVHHSLGRTTFAGTACTERPRPTGPHSPASAGSACRRWGRRAATPRTGPCRRRTHGSTRACRCAPPRSRGLLSRWCPLGPARRAAQYVRRGARPRRLAQAQLHMPGSRGSQSPPIAPPHAASQRAEQIGSAGTSTTPGPMHRRPGCGRLPRKRSAPHWLTRRARPRRPGRAARPPRRRRARAPGRPAYPRGGAVIECPSSLNVLTYIYGHSCY